MAEISEKTADPYYWQQRPLRCNHASCWAGAPSAREKNGSDGLTPFMREQWALAAPGNPQLDIGDVLASLNITPSQHLDILVYWIKEIWQNLPKTAMVVISAVLYVLLVKPVRAVRKAFNFFDWPKLYLALGILIWIRFTSIETTAQAPTPRPQYEKVVSYYLVPDVKRWSR